MTTTDDSLAREFFDVEIHFDDASRPRKFVRVAWAAFKELSLLSYLLDGEPRRDARIDIIRRADGRVLSTYCYSRESSASSMFRSLEGDLAAKSPKQFLEDVGLA